MSDIVERLRANGATLMWSASAALFNAAAAEIERLQAEAEEVEYFRGFRAVCEGQLQEIFALRARANAAEAQRDALMVAAEPFVSECLTWPDYVPDGDYLFIASPDDIEPILDEYASLCGSKSAGVSFSNDTVTVGNLRALAAAVAGAKTQADGGAE